MSAHCLGQFDGRPELMAKLVQPDIPPTPAGHALVRTSDGMLWHLPVISVAKAKERDPRLQVLHVENWRN
jgi:hypothetical protein